MPCQAKTDETVSARLLADGEKLSKEKLQHTRDLLSRLECSEAEL